MYITETTENVRKLFEELKSKDDIGKMKFLLYIFNELNNNQINNKNDINPGLNEDEDLRIFNFQSIGFEDNFGTEFLQYNIMIYNKLSKSNEAYEDNGNVLGIKYDEQDKKFISHFENLNFNEKLDVFSEIIIRYDNESYIDIILPLAFDSELSGFDIAKFINDYKKNN